MSSGQLHPPGLAVLLAVANTRHVHNMQNLNLEGRKGPETHRRTISSLPSSRRVLVMRHFTEGRPEKYHKENEIRIPVVISQVTQINTKLRKWDEYTMCTYSGELAQ